jgi:hypothetical protein
MRRKIMKTKFYVLCLNLLMVLILAACGQATPAATTATCTSEFEATIHQGPNAGLSLVGELTLEVQPSGSLTGMLILDDGSQVKAVGQTEGRAINLMFDLGNDQQIFGVGTSEYDIRECKGVLGGPFSGPLPGDIGDWRGKPGPLILNAPETPEPEEPEATP